jgi:hypothetical protein
MKQESSRSCRYCCEIKDTLDDSELLSEFPWPIMFKLKK